jgi:hypothetical protein
MKDSNSQWTIKRGRGVVLVLFFFMLTSFVMGRITSDISLLKAWTAEPLSLKEGYMWVSSGKYKSKTLGGKGAQGIVVRSMKIEVCLKEEQTAGVFKIYPDCLPQME